MEEKHEEDGNPLSTHFAFPGHMLLVGQTMSGKTNLLKQIILANTVERPVFKWGIVYTVKANMDYEWLPKQCVHDGFSMKHFQRYLAHLGKIKERLHAEGKPMVNTFCILDDCIGSKDIEKHDAEWRNAIATARHYGVTLFITTQNINDRTSSTTLRNNISYCWFYKPKNAHTWEALYKWFGGDVADNLDDFKKKVREYTDGDQYRSFCIFNNQNADIPFMSFTAAHPKQLEPFRINFSPQTPAVPEEN